MHIGQKTDSGMLPQSQTLESVPADTAGVATKRGTDAPSGASGVQHGRGESVGAKASVATPGDGHKTGPQDSGSNSAPTRTPAPKVFVLDQYQRPLDPCHPARARELLHKGRAVVHRRTPFVIRLKDRTREESVTHTHVLGVDPGSRATGLAVSHPVESVDTETGEYTEHRQAVFLGELAHRGQQVRKKMTQRAQYRRRRRSKNLRYRAPRFDNRRSSRQLAPSLQSRVDNTLGWAGRYRRWVPQLSLAVETARFDTHLLQNPEVSGVEYQQGELQKFEVREYVLHRDQHRCVYCEAHGVPLNLDHIVAKARGGSDRVSNLAAACVDCNKTKGSQRVEEFVCDPARLHRVTSRLQRGLADAAYLNAVRYSLVRQLRDQGFEVATSTGARTKYTRTRLDVPTTHALDALCVGEPDSLGDWPEQVLGITATGRGSYPRTRPDQYGFPRLRLPRVKRHHGITTGDLVRARVPQGKNAGVHIGRASVRSSGSARVCGADGINSRYITVVQPADGYDYTLRGGARDSSRP